MEFTTCLQGYTKEFGNVSDYCWNWLKVHVELFYAIFKKCNSKNTMQLVIVHKQCTGKSKIDQISSFLWKILSKNL